MSLYVSLTGLQGAQTDLSVISNNIANSNSYGFKKSSAEFGDVIATSALQLASRSIGSGTAVKAIKQEFSQGVVQSSLNSLDMAISGQGFLAVKTDLASDEVQFTRNGSFSVDQNNYVIGSTGKHLLVYPVNQDGRVTASGLQEARALRLPETSGVPRATGTLQVTANLPSDAEVIPNNPRFSTANPYVFDRNNPLTYNESASTTVYDTLGTGHLATVFYVRTSEPNSTAGTSTWNAHVVIDSTEQSIVTGSATPMPVLLTFDALGRLSAPVTAVPLAAHDPGNGADPLQLNFQPGAASTQVADPFTILSLRQDGLPPGKLDSVSVDTNGIVRAGFSNGQTEALGKVVMANFTNPNGLAQVGDSHFRNTGISGSPLLGEAGGSGFGSIISGSIERSNVDITEELVNLITAQRNFQANAKAIETDNAMTQSILNIRN
jgi:flagellar hook protein FlgE